MKWVFDFLKPLRSRIAVGTSIKIVGTVAELASGTKGQPISEIIESLDRSKAGITAPAQGLFLNKVFY